MKKIGLTLMLAFAFAQVLNAQNQPETAKTVHVDLVCKMKVKAKNAKTETIDQVTYYFCSESCKKSFAANPKKYIKK